MSALLRQEILSHSGFPNKSLNGVRIGAPDSLNLFEVMVFKDDILPPEKEKMRFLCWRSGQLLLAQSVSKQGHMGNKAGGGPRCPPFFSSNPLKIIADPNLWPPAHFPLD